MGGPANPSWWRGRGGRRKVGALVAESGDRLLRVAYQLTHERASAQDLVQEAIVRVYGSIRRRHRSPDDLYAYVRRAVLNEFLRTRRLRTNSELVTDSMPVVPVCGAEEAVVDRAVLWDRLAELSERQRAVLMLRHYEQLTEPRLPRYWVAGNRRYGVSQCAVSRRCVRPLFCRRSGNDRGRYRRRNGRARQ